MNVLINTVGTLLVIYGLAWFIARVTNKENPRKFATRWTLIVGGSLLGVVVLAMIYYAFALAS
jgi:uncharacterized membrane protein HdeD (DUF308 family)